MTQAPETALTKVIVEAEQALANYSIAKKDFEIAWDYHSRTQKNLDKALLALEKAMEGYRHSTKEESC